MTCDSTKTTNQDEESLKARERGRELCYEGFDFESLFVYSFNSRDSRGVTDSPKTELEVGLHVQGDE